jgi:hypothetical protein
MFLAQLPQNKLAYGEIPPQGIGFYIAPNVSQIAKP